MPLSDKMPSADSQVDFAYEPMNFDALSAIWQKKLAQHMSAMLSAQTQVLNWSEPKSLVSKAESLLTAASEGMRPATAFSDLLDAMLSHGQNLHHPRYVGHQVPASVPVAGLFDAVGAIVNQPMAIYEMGPWATAVEHSLVRALCRKVGWDADTSAGLLTSGGSIANLTALLTARNVCYPDSWESGLPSNVRLIAHADAHYCVTRAAGILGIGTRQVIPATLDDSRRMAPADLDKLLIRQKNEGTSVMAVVACACATPIGAFDPLEEIAEICQRHEVWLHVDAAHGGGVMMSRRHRHLLAGIHQADSLVWDAHKMMFVPALCAAVLYRNRDHRFEAFQQDAPYLFDPTNPGMAEFESGMKTLECTKRSLGFGLWGLWSMFGESIFEDMVDRTFDLAGYLHQSLAATEDFEPMHTPDGNIVVFRHMPRKLRNAIVARQNDFQQRLRTALIQSGEFYIVQTKIDGLAALRVAIMNPKTEKNDLDALLVALRHHGENL